MIERISKYHQPNQLSGICRGGEWLLKFLDENNLYGLYEATEQQLEEFIKKHNIGE